MAKPAIQEGSFGFRLHLQGMRPEDALEVVLPAKYARLRINKLIESVFPVDDEGRSRVAEMFDLRENPDLPEIYAALLDVFHDWRTGRCALKFAVNHGPETELPDVTVNRLIVHQSTEQGHSGRPILSLVVEQEYPAVDHAVQEGYWEDKGKLMEWLQSQTLLYFLDKNELKLSATPAEDLDPRLLAIAEALQARQIITLSEETGFFVITEEGKQFLGSQIAETESYIDSYDVFKDVSYGIDDGAVEFGSGRGEDLRVQVFMVEGLDPVRVVFLLRLYDGTLDEFASSWRSQIHDVKFYDLVLEPVMAYYRVDEGLIGQIIESGFAYIDEREEEQREVLSSQEMLHRVRAKHSLPSDGEEKD